MKARHYYSLFFIPLILAIYGCSSNEQSEEDDTTNSLPPSIEGPSLINWDENTPFEHSISAVGKAPFNYKLLQSPDSQLFQLDESTGVLTAQDNFNFEAPADADGDRQYEVSVIVSDADNRATTFDLIVAVKDIVEHSAKILFPIEGSNVGGIAEKIHVRGRIEENGAPVTNVPQAMVVMVNGVTAEFSDARADEWIAEVPLTNGPNTFTVDLVNSGAPEFTTTLSISNAPVKISRTAISSGNDFTYYLSPGNQAILQENNITGETITLTSIVSSPIASTCTSFNTFILNKSGDKLAIDCQKKTLDNQQESERALLIYDINSSTLDELSESPSIGNSSGWIDDRYLVVKGSLTTHFTVVDSNTRELKSISISHEDPSTFINSRFSIDGYKIYVSSDKNSADGSSYFDLDPIIDTSGQSYDLIAYTTESNEPLNSQSSIINGYQYDIFGASLQKINMATGEVTHLTLSNSTIWPELEGAYLTIVHETSEFLVLRNNTSGLLVKYNLVDDQMTVVNIEASNQSSAMQITDSDVSLKPDNSELAVYDMRNHKFVTVNLDTYATTALHDFSDIVDTSQHTFGRISYDWDQQVIYRHRVFDWGGIAPSEAAHIVATDINSHTHSTLISGFDIESIVGSGSRYRMGDVRRTNSPDQVWFSVKVYNQQTGDEMIQQPEHTYVYSYNLQTAQAQLLYTPEAPVGINNFISFDEPFLSDYSSKYNGVALTAWNNGYLATLNADGSTEEYVRPFDPYMISIHSTIDEINSRIFMAGYLPIDPYADPYTDGFISYDSNSLEFSEVDLSTGQAKVVASREVGNGLPFPWAAFRYDENRDLLMDFSYGHIFIIDPNTGDRVLKSLDLP